MPIVQNNINSNSIGNDSNNENDDINDNFRADSEDGYKKRIYYLYSLCKTTSMGILHTFLLSIFETVFYWAYITDQERIALLGRLDDFKFILNIFCVTLDNDDIKQIIQDYVENSDAKRKVNNEGPFRTSIILSIVLLILSLLSLFITLLIRNLLETKTIDYEKNEIGLCYFSKEYFLNIRNSVPLFIFICIYEFLFFQMVIYYYQPISTHELVTRLASDCIN